ncbi:hypothetical protein [Gilvimarinus sp. 1_MG-2023]|uniref:hypothetical protein n=1 Tax=Gilvimarinus sp. 1_MG-2023 TaxID=3062638 RepID=UPI0026E3E85E|nr:hypothetical protein [Gilvimarinus sp. 1_MG-2023]MDO6747292.1 hypothetical protein [Gilvimarinus sp. 1_MG-2023]
MSAATIFALIVIIFAALVAVNAVNVRQQTLKHRLRHQQRLYQALESAEDALTTVLRTLETTDVAQHINQEISAILERLIQLEPFNPAPIQARMELAHKRQQQLAAGALRPSLRRLCSSDTEIATLQLSLGHGARIIHSQLAAEKLSPEQARLLVAQIDWARLMVSVLSIIAAGYSARDNTQITAALSYFQKAQDLLQGSSNPDPRRLEMVRQLSAVMQHPKATVEHDLFPESADGYGEVSELVDEN